MRNISAPALAELATRTGTEPINILDISWVDGSGLDQYADRDIGSIKGRILSISELDAIINVSGGGYTQTISVVLDDTDGSIKAILDANDIHKRPCYLYQYFEGLDIAERFLIFQGQVSSPITWNEGERKVSFTLISKLEDREIGFSAEEGAFATIPERLIGQPWPLIFGTAFNVPALAISDPLIGTVTSGAAIHDYTIQMQINVLNAERASTLTISAIFRDQASYWEDQGNADLQDQFLQRKAEADSRASELLAQIGELAAELATQVAQETSPLTILGGEGFPQATPITLDIGGGLFSGHFTGNQFTVVSRTHPKQGLIEEPFVQITLVTHFPAGGLPRELVGYREVQTGESAGFFFADAGSRVKLSGPEPNDYVVSITPGDVLEVKAKRNFEGIKRLVTVPSDLYTVRTETFGSISAVIVRVLSPLSKRVEEGWEDDLYVTFESDIGPNTVDVLEYLIETYTPELTADPTTFAYVRDRLENYPSNFALLARKNVVQALEEIAWQARCAIWLSGETFYLRYLAEVPTEVDTITVSDVMPKTMEVYHTDTEDLVTKLVAEWVPSYDLDEPNKVILKHNVNKYGTQEQVTDFYIYTNQELVIKSATFWLIRMSNTWKKMRFSTPINKLKLEALDAVELDFSQGYVATGAVVGICEQANYDSSTNEIKFEVWTPVRSGEMTAYNFAWPADIDQSLVFPTIEEEVAGNAGSNGPGKDADGDLSGGTVVTIAGTYRAHQDYGDPNPSDDGDVAPTVPAVSPITFDLTNPGLITPLYTYSPYSPATSGAAATSAIEIHTTIITDSVTGESTTLDTFFKQIKGAALHMKAEVAVTDESANESAVTLKYHSASDKFAPEFSFLKE